MGGVRKMPEYIERDECRNEFYESVLCILQEDSTNDRANQIIDAFDDLPTADVVPLVRCKDCKHYTNNIHDPNLRDNFCNRVEQNCFDIRSPNGYCNYGERIDGDDHAKEN